ncbi:MAG: BtpA/SgcQ family protein [Phycisphaerae bacterium]
MPPTWCTNKCMLGMIHAGAMPGTPRQSAPLADVIRRAAHETEALMGAGFDGVIVENMHDVPYLNGAVGPEVVAGMTAVVAAVRGVARGLLGVQVLAGANCEALAVALAGGADFVRVENFVFAHVADEGLMPTAAAGPLLRYRRQIGAEHIAVFADIKKKHASHALTADVSLATTAAAAEFAGADGVIVTGVATGAPTAPAEVAAVRRAVKVPVAVGSGITPENLPALWSHADVFIVGSSLKRDGMWSNELDPQRVAALAAAADALRRGS